MIELKNIIKTYKIWDNEIQVLKGIDLKINEWEFISIMGPSGSWKSTLMNIIWMLDIPSEWEYIFNGKRIDNLSDNKISDIRWKNIGFIFQNYNLIPRANVIKQVMLPLMYQWVPRKERIHIAQEVLNKVGLWDRTKNKPNELSGGQQQRVSIARALAVNPKIILADEPTWALDTKTWKEVMQLLTELNKEWKTIILITHEEEIAAFAKRHIMIRDWKIVK